MQSPRQASYGSGRASRLAGVLLGLALGAAPVPALACTLLAVKTAKEADLEVYFTRFETEDKTGGKYKTCKIVKKKRDDTKTFFVTPFRQDATVVVHKKNWPR